MKNISASDSAIIGPGLPESACHPRCCGRKLLLLVAAIGSVLYCAGCFPYVKIPYITEIPASAVRTDWSNYGAYYEVNDLTIETTFFNSGFAAGAQTKYVVNKRIRILTADGARYGSILVPLYAPITDFIAVMKDSLGHTVDLDLVGMQEQYEKNGMVVFPKAAAGCELDLTIAFTNMNQAFSSFTERFYEPIPVLSGHFTVSYLASKYLYDFKDYRGEQNDNFSSSSSHPEDGKFISRTWSVNNCLPASRIPYLKPAQETCSRVAVVLRQYYTGGLINAPTDVYSRWEDLAKQYKKFLLKTSFFSSDSKLLARTHELTDHLGSDSARADALLEWVQENITYSKSTAHAINPDKVLEKREGNMWEMTLLLKEMLQEINLYSDIVVTSPKTLGGFDPDFVTPGSLGIPVIIAEAAGKKYIAYPFMRGSKLGECPSFLLDLKGLSLERGYTVPLPQAVHLKTCTLSYTLQPDRDSVGQILVGSFGNQWAIDMRSFLLSKTPDETRSYFREIMASQGLSDAITSCSVTHLHDRGEPVVARIELASSNGLIRRKEERILQMGTLFRPHFNLYDTSRTSPVFVESDETIKEEVIILKQTPFECHIPSVSISNPLFEVSCDEKNSDNRYYFSRTIKIKKGEWSQVQMRAIYPDIAKMNDIKEAYMVMK